MMERRRDTIVYVGGFGLPDLTASAQRALENAALFERIGYRVIVLGKFRSRLAPGVSAGPIHAARFSGLDCRDIENPDGGGGHKPYTSGIQTIRSVLEAEGLERIQAVVAYNYPVAPLRKLITFAQANRIKAIVECTEWPAIEGWNPIRNVERLWEGEVRHRVLAQRAGNVICATTWARRHFAGSHALVLPFVIDETGPKWAPRPANATVRPRRFIYAGSPGVGMFKDWLHRLIEGFALVREDGRFDFKVVGLTAEQAVQTYPHLREAIAALGSAITFHGRVDHGAALDFLKASDFSVLVRPDTVGNRFGFPTKVAEAYAAGVPTIANATGDIGLYVGADHPGILLAGNSAADVASGLRAALALTEEQILAMKQRCRDDNPFAPERFADKMAAFLRDCR